MVNTQNEEDCDNREDEVKSLEKMVLDRNATLKVFQSLVALQDDFNKQMADLTQRFSGMPGNGNKNHKTPFNNRGQLLHNLSKEEEAERRAKGQCFHCDQTWSREHMRNNHRKIEVEEDEETEKVVETEKDCEEGEIFLEMDSCREMGQSDGQSDGDGRERFNASGGVDCRMKPGDVNNGRDDPSRYRLNKSKSRGIGRANEGATDAEVLLASPRSGSLVVEEDKDISKSSYGRNAEVMEIDKRKIERDDNDEFFQGCKIGTKNITDLVKRAVRAAETEARAAQAPDDAVKAAGDAAAEFVKTAALEEFKSSGSDETAVSAATGAAIAVIDAAEVSRNPIVETHSIAEVSRPDIELLAQAQEIFFIQCLEILGKYVKAREGVDVCDEDTSSRGNKAPQPSNLERLTLDALVVQYLQYQHRQCLAPITPLPPLSLLHPHVCPEPRRLLEAPLNITGRLGTRELQSFYSGVHGNRRDRQFVFSRFKCCRDFNDDDPLFTGITLLGGTNRLAIGSDSGEVKIFEASSGSLLESFAGHQSPVTLVQSYVSGNTQLLLSSSYNDVLLWDASSVSSGPRHHFDGFDGCSKAAKFNNSGLRFAALSYDPGVLLYDVQTCSRCHQLNDTDPISASRSAQYNTFVHFSTCDTLVLWNGALWDTRVPKTVRRFEQITDYGGGGFHPSRSEVIINSEVWDMRNFKLLRSVPSLDQTAITFNGRGDVIYAMLRRNIIDVMSAFDKRRMKHPLFAAFRTLDAINYSDIATIPVDRCLLDLATEPTDSFLGLVTEEDKEDYECSYGWCLYEIGVRRPTDDDSDPEDGDERR